MRVRAEADYWAGYRFRPRLIATTRGAAWVVEDHLPLLVRIDSATGEVGKPRRLTGSGERGAHELVSGAGAVWIRWNDGVTRIDALDGSERWLPLSAASLAAGDAGVWALAGDGRLVRIDPAGGDYVTLGAAEVALGHAVVLVHEQRHHRADDRGVHVPKREVAQVEQPDEHGGKLVRGGLAHGGEAPVLDQRAVAEHADVRLRVADVDREQH
jgi:hypothetical protein